MIVGIVFACLLISFGSLAMSGDAFGLVMFLFVLVTFIAVIAFGLSGPKPGDDNYDEYQRQVYELSVGRGPGPVNPDSECAKEYARIQKDIAAIDKALAQRKKRGW